MPPAAEAGVSFIPREGETCFGHQPSSHGADHEGETACISRTKVRLMLKLCCKSALRVKREGF